MLDWISGYVARWSLIVAGGTRNLVQWGLHALAGVVYTVFGNVGKAWRDLLGALQWLHARADDFLLQATLWITHIVTVTIPHLAATALGYLKQALAFADHVYQLAIAAVARLEQLARQWVADAITWVLQHVWKPLDDALHQVAADLLKWGYYAYQLVTHPAQLAAILLDALVAATLAAFDRIAPIVGEFALRLVLHQIGRWLALAERIFLAVF